VNQQSESRCASRVVDRAMGLPGSIGRLNPQAPKGRPEQATAASTPSPQRSAGVEPDASTLKPLGSAGGTTDASILEAHLAVEGGGQGVHTGLDLQASGFDRFCVGVSWDLHEALNAVEHSGKGLGQNEPIPALESPGSVGAPGNPGDRQAGESGDQCYTLLGLIAGSDRPVRGDSEVALSRGGHQLPDGGFAPSRRAAPYRSNAELGDDAGDDFAVAMATDQDFERSQLIGDSD